MDKTFGEVVREYFPEATNADIDYILWEKTGFPCFWKTEDTEACLREQLAEFKAEIEVKENIPHLNKGG